MTLASTDPTQPVSAVRSGLLGLRLAVRSDSAGLLPNAGCRLPDAALRLPDSDRGLPEARVGSAKAGVLLP